MLPTAAFHAFSVTLANAAVCTVVDPRATSGFCPIGILGRRRGIGIIVTVSNKEMVGREVGVPSLSVLQYCYSPRIRRVAAG